MGHKFVVRQDMVGLTLKQKKAIWNREWWARKRAGIPTMKTGGGSQEAIDARIEQNDYVMGLRPTGIVGVCPDKVWWQTNEASFRRGLLEASKKAGF